MDVLFLYAMEGKRTTRMQSQEGQPIGTKFETVGFLITTFGIIAMMENR